MTLLQTGNKQLGFEEQSQNNNSRARISFFDFKSPVMKELYKKIHDLSYTRSTVLILGNKGTGRSQTAQDIFFGNPNSKINNFFKLICDKQDQNSIDLKLFGNESEKGFLNRGSQATLFIKKIECLDVFLQHKLLAFLSHNSNQNQSVRLILSSSNELLELVQSGKFSKKLFELFNKHILMIPSLENRSEDIPDLIEYFNYQNNVQGRFHEDALNALYMYAKNIQIKKLKKICFQISTLYLDKPVITKSDISVVLFKQISNLLNSIYYDPSLTLIQLTNHYSQLSLNHFKSKTKSARALGVSVKTLYNKIHSGQIILPVK